MATSKEYLHFILDQLSDLTEISYRCAFGEYMIYYRGKIAAYLCDDRLLVKPVPSAVRMMPDARYEPPYEGAKDMLLVENVDDHNSILTVRTNAGYTHWVLLYDNKYYDPEFGLIEGAYTHGKITSFLEIYG